MAQRRQNQARAKADPAPPAEDFDFLASQQSSGSDDHAYVSLFSYFQLPNSADSINDARLQLAVAQQLMTSKEKKRKEMEKKFFQTARMQLTNDITQAGDEVMATVHATEQIYAKFILDYAASEDAIRALWSEIREEEQKLLDIAKKQRAVNDELGPATEKAQIASMAQVKEACYDCRKIIETLLPAPERG
ncbi:hypothetical protein B0H10DRAFT_1962914 [Mycena sp. CBHHK59/15]|nr:hypothetical protein B0H10DRAFT_1962914 [Mycena sp. CBHHK59/15]